MLPLELAFEVICPFPLPTYAFPSSRGETLVVPLIEGGFRASDFDESFIGRRCWAGLFVARYQWGGLDFFGAVQESLCGSALAEISRVSC